MKFKIEIKLDSIEKTTYGQNTREIGSFTREFNQDIPLEEVAAKFNKIYSEAKIEISEIFNRLVEAEALAAAKAKAEAIKGE